MQPRHYYYLISGLPDIVPEQSKMPFALADFRSLLRETLHPEDFGWVELLLLPADNRNLLQLVTKVEGTWDDTGKFSPEALEEGLKEPGRLPAYMYRFHQAFKEDTPLWPELSWENQLTRLYYEYALENTSGFLHEWFTFDNSLKNFLVAWNIREYRLAAAGQLIGDNLVTEAARQSHARDLGLARELDWLDKLLSGLERDSLSERERTVDRIRWAFIEELNTFNYFTIEVVLGYFLQLLILERWTRKEAERGKVIILEKIEALENGFEIPQKFALA